MVADFIMARSKSNSAEKDSLEDQFVRAEDIILGSLGFGEEARIISIKRTESGFLGRGAFEDGEEFDFENEEDLGSLELWALDILESQKRSDLN
jgi:hypothetical protein